MRSFILKFAKTRFSAPITQELCYIMKREKPEFKILLLSNPKHLLHIQTIGGCSGPKGNR